MNYKKTFSGIYDNYGFGGGESRSGPGSSLQETKKLRETLKSLIKEKDIKTVVDIPCGDFNWMKEIVDSFDSYIGGDIVSKCITENNIKFSSESIKFIEFDLIEDKIPEADIY